jgi:hypothetical protein
MDVIPISGEPSRFFVPSQAPARGDLKYLVDLSEYRGNGWCGCWDFEFRRQPRLERGAAPGTERCKHIRKVLALVGGYP